MGLDINHFVPANFSDETSFNYFEITAFTSSPLYLSLNSKFIKKKDFGIHGFSDVIYFESKGYQRSGMNTTFYDNFTNDMIYFNLNSVIKAYQYLKGNNVISLLELQENFQRNFINNFVEGQSIFHVSW